VPVAELERLMVELKTLSATVGPKGIYSKSGGSGNFKTLWAAFRGRYCSGVSCSGLPDVSSFSLLLDTRSLGLHHTIVRLRTVKLTQKRRHMYSTPMKRYVICLLVSLQGFKLIQVDVLDSQPLSAIRIGRPLCLSLTNFSLTESQVLWIALFPKSVSYPLALLIPYTPNFPWTAGVYNSRHHGQPPTSCLSSHVDRFACSTVLKCGDQLACEDWDPFRLP
jgi:hypothetical protein